MATAAAAMATAAAATDSDDRTPAADPEPTYKTKLVEYFGRFVPIVLQNDNGPCPLIAICNVLLLKNLIQLSSEDSEVPLKKLLSLVAERLLDSNSHVQDGDAGFVKNQQQNMHDAIEMLPRLATGIDVNLHFRKIDDFEFTPERALFDLLGIDLYHGWIVDPQDVNTLIAIGSKSYNALMSEIVFLEQSNSDKQNKSVLEEDVVDFVAATTATLGVPSPCLARVRSFDDASVPGVVVSKFGRGDREEEDELLRVLELSKADITSSNHVSGNIMSNDGSTRSESSDSQLLLSNGKLLQVSLVESVASHKSSAPSTDFPISEESANCSAFMDLTESTSGSTRSASGIDKNTHSLTTISEETNEQLTDLMSQVTLIEVEPRMKSVDVKTTGPNDKFNESSCTLPLKLNSSTDVEEHNLAEVSGDGPCPRIENSEPIYEGEETIFSSRNQIYENREPMYEGEMVLAEQADRESDTGLALESEISKDGGKSKLSINAAEGELIQSFLRSNASQLTVYGLFCLQEGLKEHELCVFFRNNHFSTMFKFNSELYLLVTDQGYLNKPGLVWEKLNEVNGDSVFYTGDFAVYSAESQTSGQWDEQHAVASTADYLSRIDNVTPEGSTFDPDLQYAIDIQRKEFEQQQQQQASLRQHSRPQLHSPVGASRLVTGPTQGPRSNSAPPKPEGKPKDKCTVM